MINTFLHMPISAPPSATLLIVTLAVEYGGVVAAVAADFVSGVIKSRRAGVPRTSRGYRRTFDKLLRYLTALASHSLVDAVILAAVACLRGTGGLSIPLLPVLTSVGALAMALIEAKSICERVEDKGDFHRGADMVERLIKTLTSKNPSR